MQINLHLLRIFFTVVEQQSFSRAAQVLFISQPAVSKAVRELERQLELSLLERNARSSRGIRLTGNGAALFEHARGIFALERSAVDDIQARIGLRRGRLTIGASLTVAGYWLPPHVATFAKKFPTIDLKIQVGNTRAICDALIDCNIDLAIVEGAVNDDRIVSTYWRDDELSIVASACAPLAQTNAITVEDLNQQTWLQREPGSGTREVNERLMRQQHLHPNRILEFGSNEGILRAVAAGAGIALLPTIVTNELFKSGNIQQLNYPVGKRLVRPLFLLELKERPLSPSAHAFCQTLCPSTLETKH